MSALSKTANRVVTGAAAFGFAALSAAPADAYETRRVGVPVNGDQCHFSYNIDKPRSSFKTTFTDCCDHDDKARVQVRFKDGSYGTAHVRSGNSCGRDGGGREGHEGNVGDPAPGGSTGL